jgi:16S rRNA processing protein RimM
MDLLAIGIVKAPHGVRGELTVRSFSGSTENWKKLREASFRKGEASRIRKIESMRPVLGGALMRVEGCDTREKAQELVGSELWAERVFACPLSSGEYYTADLCKCDVFFGDERIGAVRSIMEAGPNQLLEIRSADGRTLMVPFIDRFIGEVDITACRISLKEDYIVR